MSGSVLIETAAAAVACRPDSNIAFFFFRLFFFVALGRFPDSCMAEEDARGVSGISGAGSVTGGVGADSATGGVGGGSVTGGGGGSCFAAVDDGCGF